MSRPVAWHWVVAGACFAALAVLRGTDGSGREAVALGALALVAAALAVARGRGRGSGPVTPTPRGSDGPDAGAIRRTHDVYLLRLRGWRACAVAGLVAAVAGLVLFPPLALVAAPVMAVALHRVRHYAHDTRILARALGTGAEACSVRTDHRSWEASR